MMVMMTKSVIDDDSDKVGDDKSVGQYNKGGLDDDDDIYIMMKCLCVCHEK